jgi:hypothetical protein
MNFNEFLQRALEPSFWQQRHSLAFTSASYPISFFTHFFNLLKKTSLLPAPYQRLYIDALGKGALQGTLSQSMLGDFSFFWLGNLGDEKESKMMQEAVNYITAYKGPHTVAFFLPHDSKLWPKNATPITLPVEASLEDFYTLAEFFSVPLDANKKLLARNIFASSQTLALENCLMLLNYIELVGSKTADSYQHFLTNILGTPPTLQALSEQFFARNSQQFFALWVQIEKEYSDIFWIVFWSEQIWRAYNVVAYLEQKNFAQAKKMSFRLPYSFINKHWQKTSVQELAQGYEFLYRMDYGLKTGSTFCGLDLFYASYFNGKFKTNDTV